MTFAYLVESILKPCDPFVKLFPQQLENFCYKHKKRIKYKKDEIMLNQLLPIPQNIQSIQLPSLGSIYLKALISKKKGLKQGESFPQISKYAELTISQSFSDHYHQICQADSKVQLITMPQVLIVPLHFHILSDPLSQMPIFGLIHAKNEIMANSALPIGQKLGVLAWVGESRWKEKGMELDLWSAIDPQFMGVDWAKLSAQETEERMKKASWICKMTVFKLQSTENKSEVKSENNQKEQSQIDLTTYQSWDLSADLGRRYAAVSGDYNPIHLYPFSSKLFGFKSPIIHGMWSLARVLGELEKTNFASQNPNPASQKYLEVKFKRPIPLPSTIFFKMEEKLELQQKDFTILLSNSKVALDGKFIVKPINA